MVPSVAASLSTYRVYVYLTAIYTLEPNHKVKERTPLEPTGARSHVYIGLVIRITSPRGAILKDACYCGVFFLGYLP